MEIPALQGVKKGNSAEIAKITALGPSIAAIAVSLFIAIFIVWPKFSEVLRLKGDNVQLEQRSLKLEDKAQILASLNREDLESQLTAANQLLPSDKGVFTLINDVEKAAGASGVLLDRIEVFPGNITGLDTKSTSGSPVQAPAAAAGAQASSNPAANAAPKIQLKISVSSDYKSFMQFIGRLLSNPRVVSLPDLAISSASSGGSGQIRTSMQLDAYWQPTPTELSAIETLLSELTPDELNRLQIVEASPSAIVSPVIPSVPLGRPDLFAPF